MALLQVKLPGGSWAAVPPAGPLPYGKLHVLNGDRWLRHIGPGVVAQQMPFKLRVDESTWETPCYLTQAGSRVRVWNPWTQLQPYPAARATQLIESTFPGNDWREDPIPVTSYDVEAGVPLVAPGLGSVWAETQKIWLTNISPVTYLESRQVVHAHVDLKFIRRRMDLGPGFAPTGVTITIAGAFNAELVAGTVPPAPMGFRLLESTGSLPLAQASIFGSPVGLYSGELLRYVHNAGDNFSTTEQGLYELRPGSVVYSEAFTDYEPDGTYGTQAWITERTLTAEQFATADSLGYTLEVDDIVTPVAPDYPTAGQVEHALTAWFTQLQVEIHTDPATG